MGSSACAGAQWERLKELVADGGLDPVKGNAGLRHRGKGTKALIRRVLADLGGKSSCRQICDWVEAHPDAVSFYNIRINKGPKRGSYIWKSTISSTLSEGFQKEKTGK